MSVALVILGLTIAGVILVIVELLAEHRDALAWAVLLLGLAMLLRELP